MRPKNHLSENTGLYDKYGNHIHVGDVIDVPQHLYTATLEKYAEILRDMKIEREEENQFSDENPCLVEKM